MVTLPTVNSLSSSLSFFGPAAAESSSVFWMTLSAEGVPTFHLTRPTDATMLACDRIVRFWTARERRACASRLLRAFKAVEETARSVEAAQRRSDEADEAERGPDNDPEFDLANEAREAEGLPPWTYEEFLAAWAAMEEEWEAEDEDE